MHKRTAPDACADRERAADVLAHCELAQPCAAETRDFILQSARIERRANRDPVYCFAQPVVDLALVVEGILEVSHANDSGKRHVNAFLPAGGVFGLIPLIDGKGSTHDAWARGPVTLMRIPRAAILHCMASDPAFQQAVMLELCERTRAVFTMLGRRALSSLRARTAWTIGDLAAQHGFRRDNCRKLNLRLSQDGLADLLGVTRQSTNRELKLFERAGMIRLGVSEIEVLDIAALREASTDRHGSV